MGRIVAGVLVPIVCATVALIVAGCVQKGVATSGAVPEHDGSKPFTAVKKLGNDAFYKADGAFDAVAAKEAYFDMMRAFGYPIPKVLRTDDLWVADFLQRDYECLGMAGIFWYNAEGVYGKTGAEAYDGEFKGQKFGYLGHEIYLLPGQMLPEHSHAGGEKGYGPKMEAWQIRHGSVTFFGEYATADGGEKPISEMPKDEQPWGFGEDWFKSKYYAKRSVGDIYVMNDPESWHFQRAGPDGAIVSEYATFHNQVQFSKPGMEFGSSEAKKAE
jgi:hypothetical protein